MEDGSKKGKGLRGHVGSDGMKTVRKKRKKRLYYYEKARV